MCFRFVMWNWRFVWNQSRKGNFRLSPLSIMFILSIYFIFLSLGFKSLRRLLNWCWRMLNNYYIIRNHMECHFFGVKCQECRRVSSFTGSCTLIPAGEHVSFSFWRCDLCASPTSRLRSGVKRTQSPLCPATTYCQCEKITRSSS